MELTQNTSVVRDRVVPSGGSAHVRAPVTLTQYWPVIHQRAIEIEGGAVYLGLGAVQRSSVVRTRATGGGHVHQVLQQRENVDLSRVRTIVGGEVRHAAAQRGSVLRTRTILGSNAVWASGEVVTVDTSLIEGTEVAWAIQDRGDPAEQPLAAMKDGSMRLKGDLTLVGGGVFRSGVLGYRAEMSNQEFPFRYYQPGVAPSPVTNIGEQAANTGGSNVSIAAPTVGNLLVAVVAGKFVDELSVIVPAGYHEVISHTTTYGTLRVWWKRCTDPAFDDHFQLGSTPAHATMAALYEVEVPAGTNLTPIYTNTADVLGVVGEAGAVTYTDDGRVSEDDTYQLAFVMGTGQEATKFFRFDGGVAAANVATGGTLHVVNGMPLTISNTAGGTFVYDAMFPVYGPMGAKVVRNATSGDVSRGWTLPTTKRASSREYVRFPALPSAAADFTGISNRLVEWHITAAGEFAVKVDGVVHGSGYTMVIDTTYRVSMRVDTEIDIVEAQVFTPDGLLGGSVAVEAGLAGADLTNVVFGCEGWIQNGFTYYIDEIAVIDDAQVSTFPDPVVPKFSGATGWNMLTSLTADAGELRDAAGNALDTERRLGVFQRQYEERDISLALQDAWLPGGIVGVLAFSVTDARFSVDDEGNVVANNITARSTMADEPALTLWAQHDDARALDVLTPGQDRTFSLMPFGEAVFRRREVLGPTAEDGATQLFAGGDITGAPHLMELRENGTVVPVGTWFVEPIRTSTLQYSSTNAEETLAVVPTSASDTQSSVFRLIASGTTNHIATSGTLTLRLRGGSPAFALTSQPILLSFTVTSQASSGTNRPWWLEALFTIRSTDGSNMDVAASGLLRQEMSAAVVSAATTTLVQDLGQVNFSLTAQWQTSNAGNIVRLMQVAWERIQ
jgi:hypothetical protein